ncbi:MAG: hypothetical protein C0597_10275 [Marinilabiliales bacterium]|nr:MAG: hypothetical protein C0597_10275 [Marinilabiliales bacterium]
MKKLINLLILLLLVLFNACTNPAEKEDISGPYLGQELPDTTPRIFAPGIISTEMYERDLAVSPDGKEIYFSVLSRNRGKNKSAIVCVKQINGAWANPEVAPFSGFYSEGEPHIQPDGQKLFFVSSRPLKEGEENKYRNNIWYLSKTESGWSDPKPVGEPINGSGQVFYPSITKSGTMYFTRRAEDDSEQIYRSKLVDGKYTEPELLPEQINNGSSKFNTFISPDEDFLIVPDYRENEGCGSTDYYVSFKDDNDNWSELINLGCEINSQSWDFSPSLSPDGKYFFYQREDLTINIEEVNLNYQDLRDIHNGGGDIYWVDASVIKDLNPFKEEE